MRINEEGIYKDGKKFYYKFKCGKLKDEPTPEKYCSFTCDCFRDKKSFKFNGTTYYTKCSKCEIDFIPAIKGQYCRECHPQTKFHKNYEKYKESRIENYHKERQDKIVYFMKMIEKRNWFVSTEELFDLLEIWEYLPFDNKSNQLDSLPPKRQIEVAFRELKLFYEDYINKQKKVSQIKDIEVK